MMGLGVCLRGLLLGWVEDGFEGQHGVFALGWTCYELFASFFLLFGCWRVILGTYHPLIAWLSRVHIECHLYS
jgi:hypothetical protein